jgi:hypothetical protein
MVERPYGVAGRNPSLFTASPFGSAAGELFTFGSYGGVHLHGHSGAHPVAASSTIRRDISLAPMRRCGCIFDTGALHIARSRLSCDATAAAALRRASMRKALPDEMFTQPENSRLTMLRSWVLDHKVTEIEMKERQFWNFAALQPVAEKPWATFMGRAINVPDMPEDAQKQLGVFNRKSAGMI